MTVGTIATKAAETWERLGFAPITADTQSTAAPAAGTTGRIPPGPNVSNTPKEKPVTDVSDTFVDETPKTVKVPSPVPLQAESTLRGSYHATEQAASFDDLMRQGRG